jgi:DNA-binding transcriptional LysR family regulator
MLNEIDLSRIDLNLLVLFEIVMEERHVGRAAARLNLSPSAVSHSLGRLRRLLNDPLFLRTPKGVVPSARAIGLAGPIADVLARVRHVLSVAEPFDPARSERRFTLGAPDAVSAVLLPELLGTIGKVAPRIDISVRQILPPPGIGPTGSPWAPALAELEARSIDIALLPLAETPARFVKQSLYEEDFVIGMHAGHPFATRPTLDAFCSAQHLVVSQAGDPHGFVDDLLANKGRSRRVALTAPNFMMALALIAETELIAALPRQLIMRHAARFGLACTEPPLPLRSDPICAITTHSAMMDAGVAWLFDVLQNVSAG